MDRKKAAGIVKKSLNAKERDAIQKGYPFRTVQRELMQRLRAEGVSCVLLAEISGYHRSRIYRICADKAR